MQYGPENFSPQTDASTLHEAAKIHADPKRHKAAAKHLEKAAETAVDAHKAARKLLEKRTKKRLKKAFSAAPDVNQDDKGTAEEAGEAMADDESKE